MGKKKICMFFNDLAIYRKEIYKKLDEEYDCEWYIEDTNTNVKEFDASELKKVYSLHTRNIGPFYVVRGLIGLLRKDFDVYLVRGATRNFSLFWFCVLKRVFYPRKRIYFWTHGYYGKESKFELLFWKRPIYKLPDGLFPYNDYCRELMIKDGFNPDSIHTIHNSLAYSDQLKLRQSSLTTNVYKEHFGNNNPVLVMIGRLNFRKHLDLLFYAVSELAAIGKDYNIVLIGDGDDKKRLEQLSSELNLVNQTWFYGSCYDEKKNAELLYNADMCVVPGDVGLTAIHSLMFGLPIVTHNTFKYQGPEFEAIKQGETGDFYEYGNVDSLANAINLWFATHTDKNVVRERCFKEIDMYWNPDFQMNIFKQFLI